MGSPNVLIDGRPIEDAVVLKQGMSITVLPERRRTSAKGSWRDTVGMFADDPTFEEMVAEGRAIREADRKATLEEMDREEAVATIHDRTGYGSPLRTATARLGTPAPACRAYSSSSGDRTAATTILTVEEQIRGRLATINKRPPGAAQVVAYQELIDLLDFFCGWIVLPFDQVSAQRFHDLKASQDPHRDDGPEDCFDRFGSSSDPPLRQPSRLSPGSRSRRPRLAGMSMQDHDQNLARAFDSQAPKFEVAPVQSDPAALERLVRAADLPPGAWSSTPAAGRGWSARPCWPRAFAWSVSTSRAR